MTDECRAAAVLGKTIRFTWAEGPTKGETHEHVFHQDGTVEWRSPGAPQTGHPATERPEYAAMKVAEGIYAVSYLAASGYTLTVVLNFHDHRIVGFASGVKEWYPLRGGFEVVE